VTPFGQYPAPDHTIVHLSDTHLLANGAPLHGTVPTVAHLEAAIARLRDLDPAPEAVVFTGDLADLGEPDAYERLLSIVKPALDALGAEVIWVMGNHDEREPYASILFGDEPTDAPQDRVHDVNGLRIISLDTTVRGYHHGALDAEQLDWLRNVLAVPAPDGTLIAVHHPPIPIPMMPGMQLLELLDQEALAEVIRGTDVRGILAGHLHFSTHSTFAGVPVSVAAATCYTMAPGAPDRLISGADANQAFSVVHAYGDRLVHTTIPIAAAPEASAMGTDLVGRIQEMSLEERLDMFSRKDSAFNRGEG
jgi:3',5'-cyclic AMP phosphodiesterase CpdA